MAGSAPPAARWLLLEHPGPWPVDAVAGSGIEARILDRLIRTAAQTQTRILLIRRPGRAVPSDARRWVLVDVDGLTLAGRWTSDPELSAAVEAMADGPAAAVSTPDPIILVCAHGVHDVCCALRGRPVAAALAARWPEQVWECSHVGGDRFAPNVVLLPDGFYYGNVDPDSALHTVEQHLAGVVTTEFLRGMARFAPPVQAAVTAAYERFGPLAPHDVTLRAFDQLRPLGDHASHSTVHLQVAGVAGSVRAEVIGLLRPDAQLTCRAARETPATEYHVRSLDLVAGVTHG